MAGLVGIRAEDMEQVDALKRAKLDWPQGLPFIRPHVRAPVLVREGDELVHKPARFGFTRRFTSFNARLDKLTTSPLWRGHFGKSHGIVALSYVVEWIGEGDEKQPYLIQRADGRLTMVPALVRKYHDKPDELGFAMCTREPNRFFARFHDRMVGHCTPELMDRWLRPASSSPEELLECVAAPGEDELVAVPTSRGIGKRKAGDWSALPAVGPPLTWAQVSKGEV